MLTEPHTLFNRVVDSLDIRVNSSLAPSGNFCTQLPNWQDFIRSSQGKNFDTDPYRQFIPEVGPFSLLTHGKRPYKYILSNSAICDIRIWNPDKWDVANKGKTGQLYINFRSQYLQYNGIDGVKEVLDAICDFFYGREFFELEDPNKFIRISRIDFAVDVSNDAGFPWASLDTFVSKARYREVVASHRSAASALSSIQGLKRVSASSPLMDNKGGATDNSDKFEISSYQLELVKKALTSSERSDVALSRVIHDRAPQTLYFGKFGGALYARIYNKSASLDKQQKAYMRDIWAANGWNGESDIWRVEFSISGDFLKKAGDALVGDRDLQTGEVKGDLRDLDTCISCSDSIWTYLTSNWLKQIDNSFSDSNDWRGDSTAFWSVVQSGFDSVDSFFRIQPERKPEDEQLAAQLKGVCKSLLAIRMSTDKDEEPQYRFLEEVASWFESDTYLSELADRRAELGLDDYTSDTLYSAQVRREALSLGLGS